MHDVQLAALVSGDPVRERTSTGAPESIRTSDQRLRRPLLCPLSYRGSQLAKPDFGRATSLGDRSVVAGIHDLGLHSEIADLDRATIE